MTNWKTYKLGDLASQEKKSVISGPFGSNISSKFFVPEGIPVIRGNNLTGNLTKFVDGGFVYITEEKANELNCWAGKDDLLFTAAGTIGQIGLLTGKEKYDKYVISNKQIRITLDKSKVEPLFAFYWFSQPRMVNYIMNQNTGSTIPLINLTVVKSLPIELPDLPTQLRIVEILSALDDKIELNGRMNQTLEQMAQTLFLQFFVNDIDEDNLPEGWQSGKLSNLLKFRNGKSSPSRDNSGKYAVYGSNGIIGNADISNINEKCMVIGRVGSFCGSVDFTLEKAYVTDNAIIAEPIFKNTSVFCYLLLRNLNLNNYRGGSGQPLINQMVLSNIDVIIPAKSKIEEFEKTAISLYNKNKKNEKENELLASIRDSLLPKLMSGEIDVMQTNAEKLYEPVLS